MFRLIRVQLGRLQSPAPRHLMRLRTAELGPEQRWLRPDHARPSVIARTLPSIRTRLRCASNNPRHTRPTERRACRFLDASPAMGPRRILGACPLRGLARDGASSGMRWVAGGRRSLSGRDHRACRPLAAGRHVQLQAHDPLRANDSMDRRRCAAAIARTSCAADSLPIVGATYYAGEA